MLKENDAEIIETTRTGLNMWRKLAAEGLGTLFLTLAICLAVVGSAWIHGGVNTAVLLSVSAGFVLLGSSIAFGAVSGGHFNPAVTIGTWISGRIPVKSAASYATAQTLGAALGGLAAFLIMSQQPGFQPLGFAANGYGFHSPGKISALGVFATEALFALLVSFAFLRAPQGQRALIYALVFAGCCAAAFGVSGAGLNPARSTGAALFAEGWAVDQLWLFWSAPLTGGIMAGLLDNWLYRGSGD